MQGQRSERVAQLLKQELGELFLRRVKDPIVSGVTITDIQVTNDLSIAKVYFAAEDEASAKKIKDGLTRTAPFLRRELGKKLRLKRTPELRFLRDEALEHGTHIDTILREISPSPEKS